MPNNTPPRQCTHQGIGLPGCLVCDPIAQAQSRSTRAPLESVFRQRYGTFHQREPAYTFPVMTVNSGQEIRGTQEQLDRLAQQAALSGFSGISGISGVNIAARGQSTRKPATKRERKCLCSGYCIMGRCTCDAPAPPPKTFLDQLESDL